MSLNPVWCADGHLGERIALSTSAQCGLVPGHQSCVFTPIGRLCTHQLRPLPVITTPSLASWVKEMHTEGSVGVAPDPSPHPGSFQPWSVFDEHKRLPQKSRFDHLGPSFVFTLLDVG